ncbi:hypothetical protein M413DRAFT_442163 [Hebeloma cylindrosporum]|uniref:Uncharacterized protein n=1 Tax=Hebeloma cylindrosporum TaxID=76867 RepID=A0A0C3CNV5_HEBCY|nr:hypothetical protein M413DRAFT_442163 [Hebeloma cylindrosporum h7]
MTSGPPPSAAGSSKSTNAANTASPLQHQNFGFPLASGSVNATLPYYREGAWNAPLPPRYYGYPPMNPTINPYAYPSAGPTMTPISAGHIYGSGTNFNPHSSTKTNLPIPARPPTPPPPDPETFKDWDEIIKKFLAKTKMHQTLKGLESDMLVLNPDWEQETIPEALKELVQGLQTILDRISARKVSEGNDMDVDGANVDITNLVPNALAVRPLEERKLEYMRLEPGVQPRSQSSINKSISQFLSRTRARNDASNRQEFLHTLAEKKRKLQAINGDTSQMEISSCARVDAKPIDRDKQITYDIAKYGEGPLKKIPVPVAILPETAPSSSAEIPSQPLVEPTPELSHSFSEAPGQRKRKLADLDETGVDRNSRSSKTKSKAKAKGKAKEHATWAPTEQEEEDAEHLALSSATPEKHPGLDERLRNLETHLALRYVPSPPRTLLARLQFLEDHVIKLEKEYPPWAALHFNQPNRGWPPPPRATPVIVPPQLRSNTSSTAPPSSSTNLDTPSTTQASSTSVQSKSVLGGSKPRKLNSSLHKAVLERLEVQRAMSEMGKGSQVP